MNSNPECLMREEDARGIAPAGDVAATTADVTTCPCQCSEREEEARHPSDYLVTAEEYP